jgi:lipoprotein-anchoring transpeptidase ErfK/SrfK
MRMLISAIGLLTVVAACAQAPASRTEMPAQLAAKPPAAVAPPFDVGGEAARLRAALGREVPRAIVDTPAEERGWIERSRAAVADSSESFDRPQLLVVVDRNPGVQQLRIVLARPDAAWQDLGGSKVSTGETGRRDYYVTPTGVFLHTDLILDWRAEGTFNAQHIRGLGLKGMRVWDFGWQEAAKGWGTEEQGEIRLLMHATDPAYLEQRLGKPASKGCVRVPAVMNRFLDRRGILDADYERAAQTDRRFAALLAPDRIPTPLAGNMLVVIDSSEPPRPGALPSRAATEPARTDARGG